MTNAKLQPTNYEYDGANRLVATTDALTQTTTYAYDPNGNLLQSTDPATRTTFYEYDELDRQITQIRNYRPGEPVDADTNVTPVSRSVVKVTPLPSSGPMLSTVMA